MARAAKEDPAKDEKRAMWYLRKIPLLEGVDQTRLQQLAAAVEIREIPRRQVIYLPGDPGDRVFFINGGRVKCSKVTRDGKELTLAYRGAGQLFGELCVIDGTPRDEMAEAMKNAIITEVPRELFTELLQTDNRLCFNFACIVGDRRRQQLHHHHLQSYVQQVHSTKPAHTTASYQRVELLGPLPKVGSQRSIKITLTP